MFSREPAWPVQRHPDLRQECRHWIGGTWVRQRDKLLEGLLPDDMGKIFQISSGSGSDHSFLGAGG